MRTNSVQTLKTSANRINLNRTVMRVALIGLFISLATGNAWAHGTHYGKAVLQNATGGGTVYLSTASGSNSGQTDSDNPGSINGTSYITWNCGGSSGNDSKTYYARGTANAGYYYAGWATSKTATSYTAATTGKSFSASATNSGSPTTTTIYGFFLPIEATAAPANVNIAAEDPSATYPENTDERTLTFTTTTSNALTDFTYAPANGASGKYTFANWRRVDATHVAVDFTFAGGGNYGGLTRVHQVDVTVKGKEHATTQKCTITATFPNAKITDGSADEVFATYKSTDATQEGVAKTAVFDVENVDGTNNFDTPTFTGADASHFTYNSMSYADGKLTVNYTYNGNKETGTHNATLTLKVNDAIGGTDATYGSKAITITAHNEQEATNDASVTPAGGSPTEYATFAEALAAANSLTGSTLKLLRNVDLGTITTTNNINKAMTIDLNGKELRAAVNATDVGILTIAKAVAVTIKDSKTGGKIINEIARNSAIRTIFVNKAGATLTLESGTIAVNNLGQYASAANADLGVAKYANCTARAIHQIAGTTVNINGGRVEAYGTRSVYGIVQASSAATNAAGTSVLNITGGEIYAEGPYNILGVNSAGKVNFSGGTITSHVTTNMVDARYAADATQNKYNGYGYGIYMTVSASATATSCYFGTLNMTGGTINVTNDRSYNGNYPNYGVFFNAAAANVSSATAVAADGKSFGQVASATGSIDGGEITVTSGTQYSYGVYVLGSYNSYDNSHHTVQIKNCKITSKAYVSAYGVAAWGAINTTNGACYAGDVELTNCDVYAETLNTTTAIGVWAYATSATIFKDGTTANAATWGGEFAVAGKVVINSGKYEAKSKTSSAYAAGTSSRAKTTYGSETTVQASRMPGGHAEAYPTLIIHGGTFKATSTTTTARGVSNGGYCTIDGGEFEAYATTTTAHGLYCLSGKLTASGVKVSASATGTAYGALADVSIPTGNTAQTGFAVAGELELNNCDITATTRTGTEARGVCVNATNKLHNWAQFKADSLSSKWAKTTYDAYSRVFPCTIEGRDSVGIAIAGKATINGCDIKATAETTTAYGVYAVCSFDAKLDSIATPKLNIKNTKMLVKTNGTTTANGIYTQGETVVDGCDITVQPKTSTGYGIQALAPNGEKVTVSNTKISVTGTTTVYGLYGQVDINATHGLDRHGNLILNNGNDVNVSATSGATAYAVYLNATKRAITTTGGAYKPGDYANAATAIINGGKYTAYAASTPAYALGLADPQMQGEVSATPSMIVNDGKFKGTAGSTPYADVSVAGEPGYFVLNGGYYVKDENLDKKLGEGMNKVAVKSGTPEYTEGYRWRITDNMTGEAVCKIVQNSTSYASLEEALQVVNASPSSTWTIVMTANYTLSKGDYEIPANTTLLIPYKSNQTTANGTTPAWVDKRDSPTPGTPYPYMKLTFASGVNMTVKGKIEASSTTYINQNNWTGVPGGAYGWLQLNEGSYIDLESGAYLFAWGYVTGTGDINAKNGSYIYEDFQMGDWRGGTISSEINGNKNGLGSKGVFLLTDYYFQNVECPITYRPGAQSIAYSGCYMEKANYGLYIQGKSDPVTMVGTSGAMFLMNPATAGENTWVRKEYDAEKDQLVWTLNSGASLGSFRLKISASFIDVDMNTTDYVLPMATNFKIIANEGDINITNDICFLPGSEAIVKKEANLVVPTGKRVFIYDADDWSSYGGYFHKIGYSPSWKACPRLMATSTKLADAKIEVAGTLDIQGSLYTTAGGGNIFSTRENAGKVKLGATAPASTDAIAQFTGNSGQNKTLCQIVNYANDNVQYVGKALTAAKLKNEDGSYTPTTGATSGDIYAYMEDPSDGVYRWLSVKDVGCFTEIKGADTKQYIHPSDFVAVEANANGDHAYHNEGSTRYFVNAEAASGNASCVWWEAEPKGIIDGVTYYMANNENFDNYGTYFYWDNSVSYWKPKKITVIWKDKDGNKITNGSFGDSYSFNTSPQFYGTNPTWANTSTEKHDWIGWRDEDGNIYDKNATLPAATADETVYTAYFETSKYQYTITFKNDDNSDLWAGLVDAGTTGAELQTLFETKYNEKTGSTIPLKAPSVDKVYTFDSWNTALQEVTGAATYTATYTWTTRKYHVAFYNYDAVSVLYEADVDYNTRPVYGGVTPFRSNTSVYSYEWTGWGQGENTYDTDDDLAFVTGDVYYVATFAQTELRYQVFFKRQDGSIIDAPFFSFEETPEAFPANPTLASTVSTDYTFREWSPATLASVTEDGMVYTALFDESPRQYTAHFVNYDATSLNADQTIDYNTIPAYTGVTPFHPNDSRNSYEFSGWAWEAGADWEAGSIGVGEAFPAIKGNITFIAQFSKTLLQFNVRYVREDGTPLKEEKLKWGESTTGFPSPVASYEDETYTYTFDHWSPATVVTTVTADATYTAYFNQAIKTYSISNFGISPAGYGTVSPASLASIPGGSAVTVNGNEITVNGTIITATPAAATAQYTYAFDHWNNVPATVTSNISDIEAVFTRTVNQYEVTFNMKGHGAAISKQTKDYGSKVDKPADPSEAGYTFVGWYKEDACANAWNFASDEVTGTTILYAKWTAVTYNITYEGLNGATNSNPATYTVETPTITLANPGTRVGYTFTGWTCGGSPITQIALGSTGDKTITANWEQTGVTILWNSEDGADVLETDEGVEIGATPSFDSAEPTKATTEAYTYTFDGWTTEANGGGTYYATDDLPTVSAAATYYAHFTATANVASVTVGGATTYYTDFAEAWEATNSATGTVTLKLLQDVSGVTTSLAYTNAQNCTFDLNNHALSGAVDKLLNINTTAKFIIDDSSEDKDGLISMIHTANARLYCLYITAGEVNLKNGKIYSKNTHTYSTASANKNSAATGVYVTDGQKFIMDNGTVESESQYGSYAIYAPAGTSTITINDGLVKGHTNTSTTAGGILCYAKGLTINGGKIVGHAWTTTSYGLYLYGGSATLNGGEIEATNDTISSKGTTTAYGIYVRYSSSTYKGVLTVPSTSTVKVLAKARTSTAYAVVVSASSTGSKIQGGTFTATAKTSYTARGISSAGTITISGGTFNVHSATSSTSSSNITRMPLGIYSERGTVTVNGNPTFNVTCDAAKIAGVFAYGTIGAKGTGKYSGTIKINGGTFNVTTATTTAYGAYAGLLGKNIVQKTENAGDTIFGQHYMPGIISITDGTFNVKATTNTAYGIVVAAQNTESGAVGTTVRIPTATITGGKFNVTGTSKTYAVSTGATNTALDIQGGWYNINTNLSGYVAPTKTCNYWVLPLTGEDPYLYEVAEAYTITFNNYDGTPLQSTAVKKDATPAYGGATPTKPEDASYTYSFTGWSPAITAVSAEATYTATFSSTPRTYDVTLHTNGGTVNAGDITEYTYGTGATLPTNVTKDGHEFGGWFDNEELTGDAVTTISTTATGNKDYWAKWTQNIADRELDIVDWTNNSVTINVTNLKAVGGTNKNNWKVYVNGTDYDRNDCGAARTLTISGLSLTPNVNLLIQLKNDADVIESQHNYKIPQIYNAENATLSGTTSSSVVYVYGGKLTISGNTTLAALYVCPGAEVEVTDGTLTVGKLVLRTKPWATAAISGSVDAVNTYYTRIAPDGSVAYPTGQYYQFGLPYECAISAVRLSDGTTPAYNTTWILKSYNEERRAESGTENNNWDALAADATIEAGRGYEMFSSYKYYREYYFPVTPTDNTSVAVTRHGDDKNNSGWNIVCSPLMSIYQNESDPVTGLKVSWLLADGSYDQEWPETIWPALPFSYQASATGYLDFSTNDLSQAVSAPRRAAYKEDIQTEWLHLDVKDGNGIGDHTSVFAHPDRFEATYQTGIDVAKQSFTASRALIYSSHAYGEMAFAGVADVLLENGIALTVYSPKEQELTISMRDNAWLDRMAYVWLIDNETGAQIDLLDSDYTFEAATGTTTGRFILMGRFFAPQIATDIDQAEGEQAKPKKLIIRDKLYILINDQLYDGTGKMVK